MSWFGKMFSKKDAPVEEPKEGEEPQGEIKDKEAEVIPEDNRSLILQLISKNGLSKGMDLSKVTLPTFILEPRSLLEKLSDTCVHPDIFQAIPKGATPEDRIRNVVRWYYAAYHKRPKGVKKPFNPILGETFSCQIMPNEGVNATPITYVSEQVSHHPPVSAFYAADEAKSIVMVGHFAPKSKFLGNSAASIGEGGFRIFLPEHNETYFITWPVAYVRGVLMGTLLMELGGPVKIRCPQTSYHADLEFIVKGWIGGTYNAVTGTIFKADQPDTKGTARDVLYAIEGNWHKQVMLKVPKQGGETTTLFDYENTPFGSTVVVSDAELANPNSSRAVWKDVAEAVAKNDQDGATKHKNDVEQKQRDLRAERKEKGEEWNPKLFSSNGLEKEELDFLGEGGVKIPKLEA